MQNEENNIVAIYARRTNNTALFLQFRNLNPPDAVVALSALIDLCVEIDDWDALALTDQQKKERRIEGSYIGYIGLWSKQIDRMLASDRSQIPKIKGDLVIQKLSRIFPKEKEKQGCNERAHSVIAELFDELFSCVLWLLALKDEVNAKDLWEKFWRSSEFLTESRFSRDSLSGIREEIFLRHVNDQTPQKSLFWIRDRMLESYPPTSLWSQSSRDRLSSRVWNSLTRTMSNSTALGTLGMLVPLMELLAPRDSYDQLPFDTGRLVIEAGTAMIERICRVADARVQFTHMLRYGKGVQDCNGTKIDANVAVINIDLSKAKIEEIEISLQTSSIVQRIENDGQLEILTIEVDDWKHQIWKRLQHWNNFVGLPTFKVTFKAYCKAHCHDHCPLENLETYLDQLTETLRVEGRITD